MMNVYCCLLFRERPRLHMTLEYRRNVTHDDVTAWSLELMPAVEGLREFPVRLGRVRMLGGRRDVRTLTCRPGDLPSQVQALAPKRWVPHVTCDDRPPLEMVATHVALCHRDEVLFAWRLEDAGQGGQAGQSVQGRGGEHGTPHQAGLFGG